MTPAMTPMAHRAPPCPGCATCRGFTRGDLLAGAALVIFVVAWLWLILGAGG
jgi:hypothetical protein